MHLVGGGRDLDATAIVYGTFLAEAGQRAAAAGRAVPRIGVVLVADGTSSPTGWTGSVRPSRAAARPRCWRPPRTPTGALCLDDASAPAARWWSDLDGLLVGGGLTPAYHRVLLPHAVAIRVAVADGLPYAGFSAGAMIAPQRALLGGWRLGSTAVTHEDNAEDLDQVTVVDGLGLISSTVEVHTSQWGTLSRLVAAVAAGQATSGIAVDENTVVILDPATDGPARAGGASGTVLGTGQAWFLTADDGSVRVERREPLDPVGAGGAHHRPSRFVRRAPRRTS